MWLSFLLPFKMNFIMYNLHTIKGTHFMCRVRWVLTNVCPFKYHLSQYEGCLHHPKSFLLMFYFLNLIILFLMWWRQSESPISFNLISSSSIFLEFSSKSIKFITSFTFIYCFNFFLLICRKHQNKFLYFHLLYLL